MTPAGFAAALALIAIAVLVAMIVAIRWAESQPDEPAEPTEYGDGEP